MQWNTFLLKHIAAQPSPLSPLWKTESHGTKEVTLWWRWISCEACGKEARQVHTNRLNGQNKIKNKDVLSSPHRKLPSSASIDCFMFVGIVVNSFLVCIQNPCPSWVRDPSSLTDKQYNLQGINRYFKWSSQYSFSVQHCGWIHKYTQTTEFLFSSYSLRAHLLFSFQSFSGWASRSGASCWSLSWATVTFLQVRTFEISPFLSLSLYFLTPLTDIPTTYHTSAWRDFSLAYC